MNRIMLARHGNTFGPGDKIVWVGAKEDLPLVETGEAQARALGDSLREASLCPGRIISGPLQRTRRAAEIVAGLTGFGGVIDIDDRLREIDYGSWGGKSNDEIESEFGTEALALWDKQHTRPDGVDWSPGEAEIRANALAVMSEAAGQPGLSLIITSNGILRYMYAALAGSGDQAKVKTGHVCGAAFDGKVGERLFWNAKPDAGLFGKHFG